jgi:hypothetical protein
VRTPLRSGEGKVERRSKQQQRRRKEWAVMNLLDLFATGSVGHTTADARIHL